MNLKISNRQLFSAATLILLLSISAFAASINTTSAHDPSWSIPTYAFISVAPTSVGVGQPLVITVWLDKVPPTANGAYGDRWDDLTIEVTKPDGSTTTIGPFTSDPVGSGYASYTPDQAGTYTFQFHFPGDTITGEPVNPSGYTRYTEYIGDYYEPSTSEEVTITVTQEEREFWPENPLPNSYWERPIYAENRLWGQISGNWVTTPPSSFNPYTTAPETSHIVWTRELTFGGIAGGQFEDIPYYDGLSYQRYIPSPIIIQGRLYYNEYPDLRYVIDGYPPGFYCVDLRTGETLWWKNDTVNFGQVYDFESPNQHGTFAYLWKTDGSTWYMYDAFNGNDLCTIINVPSTGAAFSASLKSDSPDGSILIYNVGRENSWIACWNTSEAIMYPSYEAGSNYYWNWRPKPNQIIDAQYGYTMNSTLSSQIPPDASVSGIDSENQILLFSTGMSRLYQTILPSPTAYTDCAISLNPDSFGELLWIKERPWPVGNVTLNMGNVGSNAYAVWIKETREWYCYNLTTGQEMWTSTVPQTSWDMYGMGGAMAYDKLFSYGYGGILYCYDLPTGNLDWTYIAEGIGFESYYGNYPLSLGAIADGKIYMYSTEHSPTKPQWRGSQIRCINIEDGAELWTIDHWGNRPAIADGYLVDLNLYDNRLYCYGKGQTATTVLAPDTTVPLNTPVLIQGTVTDQSPGAKDTPAIADQYMTQWMEHLYMQKLIPADAQGVTVHLTALDPNNNVQDIGYVTSDMNGLYSTTWTPPVEGVYTVMATFEGTNSYFASYAETAMSIGETSANPIVSASPTSAPPPTSETPTTTYIAIAAAAIIIIVAAAAILLHKRK
ncbi:MAG: PQQ-binding-like beta-propeller repeat protein [Candidatus Bathyarchaeota archaeon]|nr:PQQ-binding-like beta-propeller repeat protein [Candidatus Bathyarchaeota archaeon]